MTDKLQPSNVDGDKSWSWPSELQSLSEGRISSSKTNGDEVPTHLPDMQEMLRNLFPNFSSRNAPLSVPLMDVYQQVKEDEVATLQRPEEEIAERREQNAPLETTPNHDNEMVKRDRENSSSSKKGKKKLASKGIKGRMLKSKVWNEFNKFNGENGKEFAKCKHCKRQFDGSSKKGTSHLNNHLKRCRARRNEAAAGNQNLTEGGGDHIIAERGQFTAPVAVQQKPVIDDQDLKQLEVTRMVIKNWAPSLNHMRNDILKVFKEEKEKLCKFLDKLACRFSLTVEWFKEEYYFMVVHYIDDGWELKKQIIDFQREFDLETFDANFIRILKDSLLHWKIDKNVFSIVRSKDKKDEEFNEINSWLSNRGSLSCCGQLLTVNNWVVDILLLFIGEEAKQLVEKIKLLLEYVVEIPFLNEKHINMSTTRIDFVPPKLGYTKEMFENAFALEEDIADEERRDHGLKLRNLTEEEWAKTNALRECINILIGATKGLYLRRYTTTNLYFSKVCDIYLRLVQWEKGENCPLRERPFFTRTEFYQKYWTCQFREIALFMRAEFVKKYWTNSSLFLAIAVVLDPRFKMDIVECWYKEIYGNEADAQLRIIRDGLTTVFNEYSAQANPSTSNEMLDAMGRPYRSSKDDIVASLKSELDRYLKEAKFPLVEEFDILLWWRANTTNFPTLAKMAREFLAIPISPCIATSILSSNEDIEKYFPKIEIENLINRVKCGDLEFDNLLQAFVCTKCWL